MSQAGMPDTEIIDKLLLELSQFSRAVTSGEIGLRKRNAQLMAALNRIRDIASDHSSGPENPDALWEIRSIIDALFTP